MHATQTEHLPNGGQPGKPTPRKQVRFRGEQPDDAYALVQHELWYICIADLAERAEVSAQTLYNWRNGKTRGPQFYKLVSVLDHLGYTVTVENTHTSRVSWR